MKTANFARVLLALALAAPGAYATGPGAAPPAAKPQAPEASQDSAALAGATEAADKDRLDKERGGDAAMLGQANLSGVVADNSAINVVTGSNLIDSSFNNANGLPMVIQNSGANVLIQNATIINLQLR